MSLLILEDLKKHYGAQEVLRGASLTIDPGAKIGMVGRNGGGKTTLLHMITGEELPDWGRVVVKKGARLGYVPQRSSFAPGVTVREHVEGGLEDVRRLIAELEDAGERMADVEGEELERVMREHDRLTHRLDELGGWETERRAETVMSGIGLSAGFWDREARTLSGGEQSRTLLARALVGGHDLLLLDEPTNHLDLEGIEWIERYIGELETAVLVVSHDRRLLENAVDSIVELERGQLSRYAGNYSRYLATKAERHAAELRAYEVQQDFLRKEEVFIKKHMGSQRTAEAKGRMKKLRNVERLERPFHDVRRPSIRPPEAARGGELVLTAEGLAAGYGDKVLFEGVDLRVGRGQRLGVVGPNGAGKTTLLEILAGRRAPLAGRVIPGHGAVCAFHDQTTSGLRADRTPFLEIRLEHPGMDDGEVRGHLARFLFRGNDVDKPVSALSGGERARLALAKLVLSKPSWMALDEPTNHLDLASRTALEEMLGEFQGALVFVSHDREFLDGLCNHIVEVSGGRVREYRGNYTAWHEHKEAERQRAVGERAEAVAVEKKKAREKAERAEQKATKKGAPKRKAKNPYKFEKLEKRIIALEAQLGELHSAVASEAVYRDPERLKETQISIAEVEHELAQANAEWESWG